MIEGILSVRGALGTLLTALYCALTACVFARYFRSALSDVEETHRVGRAPLKGVAIEVAASYALSRALMLLVLMVCYACGNGFLSGFFAGLPRLLHRWDAGQYLPLIEHGYLAEGEEALRIVFFPLYPMLCRAVALATGWGANAVALLVSNLSRLGSGALLWRLAENDGGAVYARRCLWSFMFFPATYFFSMAFSESLFLLLSLGAVICARRRRFVLAVALGALCANTRLLGLAIAVPIYWELLRVHGRRGKREIALCALQTLPVALGLAAYLALNWRLFNDPFRFMTFERENWQQRFGTLANTFQYSLNNALTYGKLSYRCGTWIPQLVAMLGVPALVALQVRRRRAGDLAYALIYHYVAFAPTWLLSGLRYAAGGYALYLMLGALPKGKRSFLTLMILEAALLAFMTVMGLWIGVVL